MRTKAQQVRDRKREMERQARAAFYADSNRRGGRGESKKSGGKIVK